MLAFDNSYARLPDRFYARVAPTKVGDPRVVKINRPLAELLGANPDELASSAGASVLVGNELPRGAEPLALAYAGHQFGGFVPQLGDGRAILLGEVVGTDGQRRDIQLKGAGRTPFSRGGDGRAALGPVLREYLVSEAMAALGIPTTRALAVATTGERRPARRGAARRGSHARGREPPPRRHVRVLRRARRPRRACRPDLPRARAPLPDRRWQRQRRARPPRARHRRPGEPGRAVARRRLRPRRHEHRQHGDLGRDHRLRPVRVPRRRTTRTRNSARSTTAAATRSRTSPASRRGTWPASPRRCSGLLADDEDEAVRLATERLARFSARFEAAHLRVLRAKLGLTPRRPRRRVRAGPRSAQPPRREPRRLHAVLPTPVRLRRRSVRWTPTSCPCSRTPTPSAPGPRRWRRRLASDALAPDARASSMRRSEPRVHPPQPPGRGGHRGRRPSRRPRPLRGPGRRALQALRRSAGARAPRRSARAGVADVPDVLRNLTTTARLLNLRRMGAGSGGAQTRRPRASMLGERSAAGDARSLDDGAAVEVDVAGPGQRHGRRTAHGR